MVSAPGSLDLARWTILLPTRRAVRELEDIFFRLTGGSGVLLPRIRPIGDIDEDLLAPDHAGVELGTPVSQPGQLLLLMDLIDDWAKAHPEARLAQEIAQAPQQATGLAQSLGEFLDAIETEDIDVARIPELYGIESARHREAILDFLAIARETYPQRLAAEKRHRPAGPPLGHPEARGGAARLHPHNAFPSLQQALPDRYPRRANC